MLEKLAELTSRQFEILQHLANGKRQKEVLLIMGVTDKSLQHSMASAKQKAGVKTICALVAECIRGGYIT